MPNLPDLDWQPVLLVRVAHEPFTGAACGLQVSRLHLALHPDGLLYTAWDMKSSPRFIGWKPERDVPFILPVRFKRSGPRLSRLPNGTWVLPYDEEQYKLYLHLQRAWHSLMSCVDSAPHSPYTLGFVRRLIATSTYSPSLN